MAPRWQVASWLVAVSISWCCCANISAEPYQTDQWVGTNYTPAYAVNQVQFWHDFRPDVVEKELAAARLYFGITTLRVFLHNINFDEERDLFLENIETFIQICARHDIKPGFVFFDDCHRHEGVFLDHPTRPVKGYHNGRWAACPQDRERSEENLGKFREYVQDVIRAHQRDTRVLWWEIFNEPNMRLAFSRELRESGYVWAKEVEPIQPVLCCWDDSPETDIVDAHNYVDRPSEWDRQADLNPAKGAVFTEAGARWLAPRPSNGEPIEVIHWLQDRKSTGKSVPGVYLCWELMVGNSNCRWYWGTPEGTPEPTVPWCGLMWPDATPVSLAEAEVIRRYVTGDMRAMLFHGFQELPVWSSRVPSGWKRYGGMGDSFSGALSVEPTAKMVTGNEAWTDYVLEAAVMLKADTGNAGLVFRTTEPGAGIDQMRGYYIGFDTKFLYLGKIENHWQPLANYDLSQLDCQVVPGVWNQIRVAAEGPRIRIWFDRMHPSADRDHGLRIDYTDPNPILAGAVGVRTHSVPAWYDNFIVLPVDALP